MTRLRRPQRRRRRSALARALRFLLLLAILLGALWGLATLDYPLGQPRGAPFSEGRNGIWLAHTWVGDQHSRAEIEDLSATLAARGFRYLYLHAGPLEADGTAPPERYRYAKSFIAAVKARQPDVVLLAWLGGLNRASDGDLDLTDPRVRANLVATAQRFVSEGWDGVHLNVELLPTGREDYLTLLSELRAGLGPHGYLSVAGQRLWLLPTPLAPLPKLSEFIWDAAYLRAVAARVDQVAVMTYDSALPLPNLFIKYQQAQTRALIEALAGAGDVELLVGVPTYNDKRWNFNAAVENMGSGLQGVIEGLQGLPERKPFAGVAIYAHWTTGEQQWQTYDRMWLGR